MAVAIDLHWNVNILETFDDTDLLKRNHFWSNLFTGFNLFVQHYSVTANCCCVYQQIQIPEGRCFSLGYCKLMLLNRETKL